MNKIFALLLLSNAFLLAEESCQDIKNKIEDKTREIFQQKYIFDFNPRVARQRQEKVKNLESEKNQLQDQYKKQCYTSSNQ